jgi:hypothetical protein
MMCDNDLWHKLENFHIGLADARLSFVKRLARENGWVPAYAEQVVLEYKKFIYLIATGNAEMTPSDEVDQAWHLHMTYTQSYWRDLCHGVLGFKLHHNPTKGGHAEGDRFRASYQRTLNAYEQTFSEKPPVHIWPSVQDRFYNAECFVRVNRANVWIIKKPRVSANLVFLSALAPLSMMACTPIFADKDIWFWLKFAIGIWGIYILAKVLSKWLGTGRGNGGGCGGFGGCGGVGSDNCDSSGGSGCSGCGGCGG